MRRLVVVTDNPMMVGAIRAGMSNGRAFELLGYLDPRRTTAIRIKDTGADVVLVDEANRPERAIELIRAIKEASEEIAVVFLAMQMEGGMLERAFDAGASSVILKAIHPGALATFLEEALSGNIVHAPTAIGVSGEISETSSAEQLSLTPRELGILRLVAAGAANNEIAQQLWITRQTVKFHLSNIYRKLGVSNRTGACHHAHLYGIMADLGDDAGLAASAAAGSEAALVASAS
jgi:DNA-binding NarL/FixJ family response regulator